MKSYINPTRFLSTMKSIAGIQYMGFLILIILILIILMLFGCSTPKAYENRSSEKSYYVNENICGVENCNGLDIRCGPNIPKSCPEFEFGDGCINFAKCKVIEGVCQFVKTAEFEKCRSCVEDCYYMYKDEEDDVDSDDSKRWNCQAECFGKY